ncbi:MAG: hypothetical protein CMK32_13060 [Porticoccaceae bacterium]|nr:hypothetical protein [Porticoccaceae bacterium]
MSLFIIENDEGAFLDKQLNWVHTADAGTVFCTPHKDIALNQLVELTTRDFALRARVVACDSDSKGRPVVSVERRESVA